MNTRFPLFLACLLAVGCTQSDPDPDVTSTPVEEAHDHGAHDHAHPTEGPHHGSLIELGDEEYHAELVHDETDETVTIYVLDSAAKSAVPIQAEEITINIKVGETGKQYILASVPDEGEEGGLSSRFVSSEKELQQDLHQENAQATLVISINDTSYRGAIHHDHDHAHE